MPIDDLSTERFAVAAARQEYESALRNLRSAEVNVDARRDENGVFPPDFVPELNPGLAEEIAALQAALDSGVAEEAAARGRLEEAVEAYTEAAAGAPLFESDNTDPVLLLPVRLEAIYAADKETGAPELWIRVYPDDLHVDAHEPALTERERDAGVAYWRAVRADGDDTARRAAAWQALVGAAGGPRANWVREVLTPLNQPPAEPSFPDVELRDAAWTRAAHTLLLPDHFEFSAYRDGAQIWRHPGKPIADDLAVGIAPQPAGGEAETDALAFDDASRWLVRFELATKQGMGIAVPLSEPNERYDVLTVVGVGTQDAATGAERVQSMLAAHARLAGIAPVPVRTPTNNTPGSRSAWRSREAPPDPDVVAARRAAFDPASDQEAARLARALGVDGAVVLAGVCDPEGGDETVLRRLNELQAGHYAWSRVFRPPADSSLVDTLSTAPWLKTASEHYARFVRARGPLPPLRIGRQPYGLLPVSATGLWQGDDVDPGISRVVGSFLETMSMFAGRAVHIGLELDPDALLLDLLSREAFPGRVAQEERFDDGFDENRRPPPSTIPAIPASSSFAWLKPPSDVEGEEPTIENALEPFPDPVAPALQELAAEHPLLQVLVTFDERLPVMAESLEAPNPDDFAALFDPVAERLEQLLIPPTLSLFYAQAAVHWSRLKDLFIAGPAVPTEITERVAAARPERDQLAAYVDFEDDAGRDVSHFERMFRETLEPLSHRVDAWVSSLATARLAALRKRRPIGIRYGAYGWLNDVTPADPDPQRQGYVVTPSLHHATTAAVLRSGWQAHKDRRSFAVDIQSARVRRAQAVIEGVRAGQTVDALLGYQFERALHDAQLDQFIAGFRQAYPLAPLVEPGAEDADEARVSIGARNVVDGQALRRDRPQLEDDDGALQDAAMAPLEDGHPSRLRRIIAELDETFDAVSDLLVAESVHQLVGGSPLRAGLAADAVGRGQELPPDYDVLRTPRGGVGATHHVGILLPTALPGGWEEERPLAALQPGLEGWLRHRLGPASKWSLEALDWCATEVVIATPDALRSAAAAAGVELDEAAFQKLMVVCERLRAALATAVPLTPTHLDPADPAPLAGYDLGELHGRIAPWLADTGEAAKELRAARSAESKVAALQRLGSLGVPVGRTAEADAEAVSTLLGTVDFETPLPPPPDGAGAPREADAWLAGVFASAGALLHPAVKVTPVLTRKLPPAPEPAPDDDAVAAWLGDMVLVRPRVEALDAAGVAAEVLAGTAPSECVVAQPPVPQPPPGAPRSGPWIAAAPPPQDVTRPQCSLVLQRDRKGGPPCGLVVDSWTEVVPRSTGKHGPEEVVGIAFDFDRPGARAPQSMLIAVPPDPARGWCMEDLHACLDEVLLLVQLRTLDLEDMPEMRTILPIPGPS